MNERDLENVFNDQARVIERFKPQVVLGDTSPSLKMTAEKANVRFISLMNGYISKYYAFSRNLSRTHFAYPILKMLPKMLLDALSKKGEAITMVTVHHPFKKIRKKYSLLKIRSYLDVLEGDVNLLCDLDELFPQKGLPDNYRLISPLYYDVPVQSSGLRQKLNKTKKTIFVSMGSTGDWQKMFFLNDHYFDKYNLVTAGDDKNILNGLHIIKADL